eukprot:scaffold2934_cov176-Amphora_coffeaeformis.AAC.4
MEQARACGIPASSFGLNFAHDETKRASQGKARHVKGRFGVWNRVDVKVRYHSKIMYRQIAALPVLEASSAKYSGKTSRCHENSEQSEAEHTRLLLEQCSVTVRLPFVDESEIFNHPSPFKERNKTGPVPE